MKHLIDTGDLSAVEVSALISVAEDIISRPQGYTESCRGKILATLFYEASTRTRLSFESAMLSMGGSVLGFQSGENSSASKGESVSDSIRVVSCYADICAIRHPKEGAALVAAQAASIPIINAGDGGHQHPTQTLTDLFTIHTVKRRLGNLSIGFCGDLKFGRTVHSLVKSLSTYPGNRFVFISPHELQIPDYLREDIKRKGCHFIEEENLECHIGDMDILYMTRVQRERFFNEEDYVRLRDIYVLDNQKLKKARPDLSILHPLPRLHEIAVEVDQDPRALYFDQVKYGKYIRMALILDLLGIEGGVPDAER